MNKIKRNWNKLPMDDRIAFARTVIDNQKATPSPLAHPYPGLTALDTELAALEAIQTEAAELALQLKAKQNAARAAWDLLSPKLGLNASHVESDSEGDLAIIIGLGFEVAGAPQPVGPITQVKNLDVSMGDDEGTLDAQWHPTTGAITYEIQTTIDPTNNSLWKTVATVAQSKTMLTGQQSGKRHWVRVRALGRKGAGPWSDEASKMVP